MSYRNSERKTQEMQNTIALAVAVARAMLLRRRRFFCDEEDIEEDVTGSIFLLSLVGFALCDDDDVEEKKRVFLSRLFFEWIFSNSFRGII
jgi:hypothetical protein